MKSSNFALVWMTPSPFYHRIKRLFVCKMLRLSNWNWVISPWKHLTALLGFKDSGRWWMAGSLRVSLMTTKTPSILKNEPEKQVYRGDALQSKGCRRPPRVWPRLALIIWWGLWFQVITFMWRVRRTKWVFKGKTCQVLVFLIIVPSRKNWPHKYFGGRYI